MEIELVSEEDMRAGRGGGKKGGRGSERYAKYKKALEKSIPYLKENIEKRGTIRVKVSDLTKEMGGDFLRKHATSIYWGSKYTLFNEGIIVTTGKHVDGDDVLVMRNATPDDKLPDSLAKSLNKEGEGEDLPEEDESGESGDNKSGDENEDKDE